MDVGIEKLTVAAGIAKLSEDLEYFLFFLFLLSRIIMIEVASQENVWRNMKTYKLIMRKKNFRNVNCTSKTNYVIQGATDTKQIPFLQVRDVLNGVLFRLRTALDGLAYPAADRLESFAN